ATAPSATIQPRSLYIVEGITFSLICYVDGYPTPELNWYFKGNRLYEDAKYYFFHKDELFVRNATIHDAGVYECRAVNSVGTKADFATVQLAENGVAAWTDVSFAFNVFLLVGLLIALLSNQGLIKRIRTYLEERRRTRERRLLARLDVDNDSVSFSRISRAATARNGADLPDVLAQ
ncbi:CBR-HIM-4 protein, partial [Aphelenchoides avenae]